MARENQLDHKVKNAVIRDTIKLVDPIPYDRSAVARILKRRLVDVSKNKLNISKNDPDLYRDLKDIYGDQIPRQYGETPVHLGDYQKLCPDTKIFDHIMRLKGKIINPMSK